MSGGSPLSSFFLQTQDASISQSLTLQFFIFKLLKTHEALLKNNEELSHSSTSSLLPYDWALKIKPLSQLHDCCKDLKSIFPSCKNAVLKLEKIVLKTVALYNSKNQKIEKKRVKSRAFDKELPQHCNSSSCFEISQQLQLIQISLEPLIAHCCQNENIFLFLLKNQKQIDDLMYPCYLYDFLIKIYPEGLELIGEKLCDQYHRRGFFSSISECKILLTQLLHERFSIPARL